MLRTFRPPSFLYGEDPDFSFEQAHAELASDVRESSLDDNEITPQERAGMTILSQHQFSGAPSPALTFDNPDAPDPQPSASLSQNTKGPGEVEPQPAPTTFADPVNAGTAQVRVKSTKKRPEDRRVRKAAATDRITRPPSGVAKAGGKGGSAPRATPTKPVKS